MPALVAKRQKCGKKNCRCETQGELHGPYYWIVTYRRKHNRQNRGTYEWKYLGKSTEKVMSKLLEENPEFLSHYGKKEILQILNLKSEKIAKRKVLLGEIEKID